jgi:lipoprotein-anchoring transpeptidase ErfK/SrfK
LQENGNTEEDLPESDEVVSPSNQEYDKTTHDDSDDNRTDDPDSLGFAESDTTPQSEEEQSGIVPLMDRYETPLTAGRYYIRPAMSDNKVLEVSGGSSNDCAYIQIFTLSMTSRQRFDVSFDNQTGYYTIRNSSSGKPLDVPGASTAIGTRVWQYSSNGTNAQKWIITEDPLRPGAYILTSALSSPSQKLVLDISGARNVDGNNVTIYTANGTAAQSFVFLPEVFLSDPGDYLLDDGFYTINSTLPGGFVLDISGASEADGAALQLYTPNNTLAQVFQFKRESDGFYSIHPANTYSAVDVQGGNLLAGTPIWQYSSNNTAAQRWAIRENPDGSLSFISKVSGMALDVCGGISKSGTMIWQWYPNGTAAQRFALTVPKPLSGYVTITPWTQPSKHFDVAGASRFSGANIQAYRANSSLAQTFEVVSAGTGLYAFRSVNSGCFITAGNNNVYQEIGDTTGSSDARNYTPKPSQQWQVDFTPGGYSLVNVETGQAMVLTTGGMDGHDIRLAAPNNAQSQVFKISQTLLRPLANTCTINNAYGLCIDSLYGNITNGTITQLYTPNDTAAQKWIIKYITGEYFSISCVRSLRVIDIKGNSTANGTAVQLYDYNGTTAQLWRLVPSGDGWFYLQSASGMYLTASSGSYSGAAMTVTRDITGNTQKFRFEEASFYGYSGTYVEVNLSTQKLIYVKNGVLLVACDVVSGKPSTSTPTGTFRILNKQRDTVLVGPGYASPVKYWMPFTNTGVGLHDASWQPWFGGNRYTYAGSHGCVNMPEWAARDLFNVISVGDTVWVHW